MTLDDIFQQDGRLARCLDGYEPRPGQLKMAKQVGEILDPSTTSAKAHNNLVIEAETGIGKTLAYLVPAALSGRKLVVSTATLNLQDQILEKDIPILESCLQQSAEAICVKGRENYLCLYRWYQYRSSPQFDLVVDPAIAKIDRWLLDTETGDRAELDWMAEKYQLWPRISARSNQCLGGDCPEQASCFIGRLRKRAGKARLLVVNHHLFFSDLALKRDGYGELLPRYEVVIFDEAHHLENIASTFFGRSFSHYQLVDFLQDVEQQAELDLEGELAKEISLEIAGLKVRLEAFTDLFPRKPGKFALMDFIKSEAADLFADEVNLLAAGIKRFTASLDTYRPYGESWASIQKRGEELAKNLLEIALVEQDAGFVRWYERRERSVVLSATPIEVAPELQAHLYNQVEACVLTSATLTTGGSFDYLKTRLGLDESTACHRFASPFDYQNRSLIYIPESGFPEPNAQLYSDALGERVLQLLYASRGRALVLCTSFRQMDELATELMDQLDYPVLVQGSRPRKTLLKEFRKETHSVLVAVASFWEGVDVVGESLSCVVIDKLPFEVPSDPVLKARMEQIKEGGGNPFFSFQVPRAILTLRQGVGRLIRSTGDRGVIALMDVRLQSKGYGKIFLKSLPPAPMTRKFTQVEDFFRNETRQERS